MCINKVVGKVLGGGGGASASQSGYVSSKTPEYEEKTRKAIYGRAQNAGTPIEGKAGVQEATSAYSFDPMKKAMSSFQDPYKFSQTYNTGYKPQAYGKSQFNFQGLPEQYGNLAYQRGAKDIRREGSGQLEQLKEAVGVRRPGMLMKAGQQSQRDIGEQLAGLQSDLRLREMEKSTDLAVDQQKSQAEENYRAAGFSDDQARKMADEQYRGYQSRADLESKQADEGFRNRQSYADLAKALPAMESDITQRERDYRDQAIQYLNELFKTTSGLESQAKQASIQDQTSRRGQTLGILGDAAKAAFGGG